MSELDTEKQPPTSDVSRTSDQIAPIHEIGVLLVHGIGQQRRGETLVDIGEPMALWIQQWIDGLPVSEEEFNSLMGKFWTLGESVEPAPTDDPQLEVLSYLYAGSAASLELRRVLTRVTSRFQMSRNRGFRNGSATANDLRTHNIVLLSQSVAGKLRRESVTW
jgi:hypothetical protein